MRNVFKLRGTRIFINEDLCPASQSIKKSQMPLLIQARSEGKVAFFQHTKLIIKEKSSAPTCEAPVGMIHGSSSALTDTPVRGVDGGGDGTSAHDSVIGELAHAGPAGLSAGGNHALRIGPAAAAAVSTPVSASTGRCGADAAVLSVPASEAGGLVSGQWSTTTSSRAPKKQ